MAYVRITDSDQDCAEHFDPFFRAIFGESENALARGEKVQLQTDVGDVIAVFSSLDELRRLKEKILERMNRKEFQKQK